MTDRPKPRASVIEIIGTGHQYTEDGGGRILLPKEICINGVSVYTAKGSFVKISDVHLGEDLVTVNVTLVARRIVIAADSDLEPSGPSGTSITQAAIAASDAKPYSYRGEETP